MNLLIVIVHLLLFYFVVCSSFLLVQFTKEKDIDYDEPVADEEKTDVVDNSNAVEEDSAAE